MGKTHIVLICTTGNTVVNFRKDLILKLLSEDYSISIICGDSDNANEIKALGINLHICSMSNTSKSILQNFQYKKRLEILLKEIKPDVVFTFMVKPNIWGSRAAKKCGIKNIFCMIEGMGRVYTIDSFKNKLLKLLINCLYRKTCKIVKKVFFLNNDDLNFFANKKMIKPEKAVIINGIGINVNAFPQKPLPEKDMFLMIARLLYEKGVFEFCEAAEIVKKKYPDARFCILGAEDTIKTKDLEKYSAVEYLGTTQNILSVYEQCSVYVLPSYREGMPRTILEALSVGRPIITTDTNGCKETVVDSLNGFLIPIKNIETLAEKMELFIGNDPLKQQMASESRKMAEEKFNSIIINEKILAEIAYSCYN